MKNTRKTLMGLFLLGAATVQADPPVITQPAAPGTMSYQGRLQTSDGIDYTNGTYTVDFRLYDGGDDTATLLWGATYSPYVQNGFFSVILGQTDGGEPLGEDGANYPSVDEFWKAVWIDPDGDSTERYLGITVHQNENNEDLSDPEESFPRQQLLAAPFAIQARFAQHAATLTVDGHSVSNVVEAPASGVRMVAGTVDKTGNEITDIGDQFSVERDSVGIYIITFTPEFNETPIVTTTPTLTANSGEFDNAISVRYISNTSCTIMAYSIGSSTPQNEDSSFNFIAVGQ